MAIVTAPLMSLGASGQVGGAIVFSSWKGRAYVRRLVKPANPKSGGQVGVRSMFKFLSQAWAAQSVSGKATWEDLADQDVVSPFNAFMKFNMLRNRNFLGPTQEHPPATTDTPDAIDTFTATPGIRQITIELDSTPINSEDWAYLLYRSTTSGFTPAFDNMVAVVTADQGTSQFFVDTPLDPDTYYYDTKVVCFDSVLGALTGEINATVA